MGSLSRVSVSSLSPFLLVLLASLLAWSILFVAVPPSQQNFPLIDDWAFGRGALLFAVGQGIHYGNWASMPQLGQWLWAYPFLRLLGPSFFSLRVSTLFLSWLGLWAFYDLLRQEKWPRDRAALATALMAFHPLFFLLQGTFMTDVPALSFALGALACYGRARQRQRIVWLIAAVAAALFAVLTRQNTVAVPLVFGFFLLRDSRLRSCPLWWLSALVPAGVGVAIHFWFQRRSDIIPVDPRPLPPHALLLFPFVLVHWCGLTTLPLLLWQPRIGSRRLVVGAFVALVLNAAYWFGRGPFTSDLDGLFPYTGTILTPWGASSGDLSVGERPLLLTDALRVALTLLGCLGGALFLDRATTVLHPKHRSALGNNPLVLFSLLQMPFVVIAPALWDRYLFPVILPGALVLAGTETRSTEREAAAWWRCMAVVWVGIMGIFSVGVMHDWLTWNAAAWNLGRRALARSIDPLDIEGGMEWDGWHQAAQAQPQHRTWREMFSPLSIRERAGAERGFTLPTTRVWFPHVRGRYALSFSPLPNTVLVDAEPYRLWFLSGEHRIYLLAERSPHPTP